MRFLKGHGTRNDFVVLPDVDAAIEPSDDLVRLLCDRRAGIGGDGLLRVVPTAAVPDLAHLASEAEWAMDYRNADGSIAEMCGNGVRVFGRYLVSAGLAKPGEVPVATRAGVRVLDVPADGGDITVSMGVPQLLELPPLTVTVDAHSWTGVGVSMGNPHVAVPVTDLAHAGRLLDAPQVTPADAFPHGVNVEFVVGRGRGRIAMRVHERGVGETPSCGTGACAAAVAAAVWWAPPAPWRYVVGVPGGEVVVAERADGEVTLTGPAVLVAEGELDDDWLRGALGG